MNEMTTLVSMRLLITIGNFFNADMAGAKAAGIDYKDWWMGAHRALLSIVAAHIIMGVDEDKRELVLENSVEILKGYLKSGGQPTPANIVEDFLKSIHKTDDNGGK